ncbi:Fc receptor-like protein 5 [Silurus meridionalis]|nr:Fc receptor-like protein 5 [Silurus meridionalis]
MTQHLELSDAVTLNVSEKPVPVLSVSSKNWLTEGDSVTLSCEVKDSFSDWTFSFHKVVPCKVNDSHIKYKLLLLSDSNRGSGGSYTLSHVVLNHTGFYICRGERGNPTFSTKYSSPKPLWITDGDVILESPVHPVTEGDPLTLCCLIRNTNSSNLRLIFYKDGSVVQNQTTEEMIIHKASKSDEGFYRCEYPERGNSTKSWVSVRRSSHVEAPFSVLMLISRVVTASPYLLITIILLVKYYRARAQTNEKRIETAVLED